MRCLMPATNQRAAVKPASAREPLSSSSAVAEEVIQLEIQSQRQLEDDIARIFDESIYSDLEVVCGKLKILTHSCILKARTHKFYHKLEAILHANIGRKTFDEIYSFISDAYTECDIHQQEKEIIDYLNENLSLGIIVKNSPRNKPEDKDESEAFSTPNCTSPEEKYIKKQLSSSPSTELTKEYYALVPIDGNVLDKELIEQDALSNAFQSINKLQFEDINSKQIIQQCVKPTSLCLNSSHTPNINKHPNNCDILKNPDSNIGFKTKAIEKKNNSSSKTQKTIQQPEADKNLILCNKTSNYSNLTETSIDKVLDSTYTPDSLITDEPSSSSDYLSAAYAVSPETVFSSGFSQLNVGENVTKMDNIVTVSDSGLETSGMLESLNSHKDVTLTDLSLTESTLHDINDENNFQDSAVLVNTQVQIIKLSRSVSLNSPSSTTSTGKDFNERKSNKSLPSEMNSMSTKEDKQRQNEEIVILESSSLSSETGSWESVFPPKLPEKDLSYEKLIETEFKGSLEEQNKIMPSDTRIQHETAEEFCPSLVHKSPYKSTSCFIDAASLADESESFLTAQKEISDIQNPTNGEIFETQTPCTLKRDLSPNDWSDSNENDDSLERADNKDPDSIQKDLPRTLIEMATSSEDSLYKSRETTETTHDPEKETTVEYNQKLKGTHDPVLSGYFQSHSNAGKDIVVEQNYPKTGHESLTSGNGLIKICPEAAKNVSVQQNDPKAMLDTTFAENKFMEFTPSKSAYEVERTTEVEVNPKETRDAIIVGNSCMSSTATLNVFSTPNNSMISVRELDFKMYKSKSEINGSSDSHDNSIHKLPLDSTEFLSNHSYEKYADLSTLSLVDDSSVLDSQFNDSLDKKNDSNNVSRADIPEQIAEKSAKALSTSSFWVVDMGSDSSVKSNTKSVVSSKDEIVPRSKQTSNDENHKSRSSVDSNSSEKSTRSFYIDLSTLPDTLTTNQKPDKEEGNEKRNMFSMFIDLGDKSITAKEIPPRFSAPVNKKADLDNKSSCQGSKNSQTSESNIACSDNSAASTSRAQTDESVLFEQLEEMCADPNICITEIKKIKRPLDPTEISKIKRKDCDLHNKVIQEEPSVEASLDLFVKLSDLDKPAPKAEPVTINIRNEGDQRMSQSIPDNGWRESTNFINLKSCDIISSFHSENALSLNRLFPHLKNDFSRSMPGSLSSRTKSPSRQGAFSNPGDVHDPQTIDVSEMSSVQSSYCRSVVENSTTEDTDQTSSLLNQCQSRLGQDLLRMFLEEIAPDVIVEVNGRRIKAHKCILSSRCRYFAGILGGGWVESAGNIISLPSSFSFSAVHFVLCHIYSGVTVIPDSLSIIELATLVDLLGLEGLKEAIVVMLKSNYCHHFHKPCGLCIAGVLQCFPLAALYEFDDLYRKCLRWITKYFFVVWPTQAFAGLPMVLLDRCCQEHIVNLSAETLVDTVYGCGVTVTMLASNRWAHKVACLCQRVIKAASQFAAACLCDVLRSTSTVGVDSDDLELARQALNDCVIAAIESAAPDEACRAYQYLCEVGMESRGGRTVLGAHASSWRRVCEAALVREAPRLVHSQAFAALPAALRDRLRSLGCIAYAAPAGQRRRPASRSAPEKQLDHVRACFEPYNVRPSRSYARVASPDSASRLKNTAQPTRPSVSRNRSMPKSAPPPNVRTTKAQEKRAKFNSSKTNQTSVAPARPKVNYDQAKSRYLEPRQSKPATIVQKKSSGKMISSSESSRNSSPKPRGARARPRPPTADPSTDSLSESYNPDKYATYTKAKHNTKGSIEAVQRLAKSQTCTTPNTKNHSAAANSASCPAKIPVKSSRIPVYHNKSSQSLISNTSKESQRRLQGDKSVTNSLSPVPQRNKPTERKPSGSLMNATKSSQAKMVSKPAKETVAKQSHRVDKTPEPSISKAMIASRSPDNADIPIMERSGTFLKDEPMFGDKTTDIDIDE